MSLTEESDGLLETHVTWNDIQKDLFELFGPSAVLGTNKTIRDIADGKGYVSRIGVIENLWEDEELAEKSGWPKKFAVKMVTLLQQEKYSKPFADGIDQEVRERETREKAETFRKIHNTEIQMYEKLAEEKDLQLLKIYKYVPFTEENESKGYLLMEFVENAVQLEIESEFSNHLVDQTLESLAKLHSKTPKFSEEEREKMKVRIYSDLFSKINEPNLVSVLLEKMSTFVPSDLLQAVKRASEKFMEEDYAHRLDNMSQFLGMKNILCHGDTWTMNILLVKGDDGEIRLKALIDLQVCHFGCPGFDLARLLSAIIGSKERTNNWEKLIETYYSYFVANWPKGVAIPFIEEQIKESYKGFRPFALFIVIISLSAVGDVTAKKAADPEKAWEHMKEKIIGMVKELEDCL